MHATTSLLLALLLLGCGRTGALLPSTTQAGAPPVGQVEQPVGGCAGKSLVALEGREILRLEATGEVRSLFTFGAGQPEEQVSVGQWQHRGQFLAGSAYLGSGPRHTYELVLLDVAGQVRFHAVRTEPYSLHLELSESGALAVAGAQSFLVQPDGTVTQLGDLWPMTPLLADGSMLVSRGQPWLRGAQKLRWRAGAVEALAAQPTGGAQAFLLGERAAYLTDDARLVVLDGPSLQLPKTSLGVVGTAAGRFVLLSDGETWLRVDVDAGVVAPVHQMPSGYERYGVWHASLAEDGSVLVGAGLPDTLLLNRSWDLGASWSRVGEPLTPGVDLGGGRWLYSLNRGPSVLVASISTGYGHFVNEVRLVHPGGVERLDTGGMYANVALDPGALDLSADGQCAAAWSRPRTDANPLDGPFELKLLGTDGVASTAVTWQRAGWFAFVR